MFQNTCYLPNQPTPRRSFAIGEAIAAAVEEWKDPASVAVIASGGLSHFVVDEELDRTLLGALERNDARPCARSRATGCYSAGSESLNWVALGGAMQQAPAEDGAARLRPGLSHAGRHGWRLGLRPLAVITSLNKEMIW